MFGLRAPSVAGVLTTPSVGGAQFRSASVRIGGRNCSGTGARTRAGGIPVGIAVLMAKCGPYLQMWLVGTALPLLDQDLCFAQWMKGLAIKQIVAGPRIEALR